MSGSQSTPIDLPEQKELNFSRVNGVHAAVARLSLKMDPPQ
jgi:hypothetical protein